MIEVTELPRGPVVEYQVAMGRSATQLAAEVNKLLAQGWQLHGCMVASDITIDMNFYQPMVRHVPAPVALFEGVAQQAVPDLLGMAEELAQVQDTYAAFLAGTGRL